MDAIVNRLYFSLSMGAALAGILGFLLALFNAIIFTDWPYIRGKAPQNAKIIAVIDDRAPHLLNKLLFKIIPRGIGTIADDSGEYEITGLAIHTHYRVFAIVESNGEEAFVQSKRVSTKLRGQVSVDLLKIKSASTYHKERVCCNDKCQIAFAPRSDRHDPRNPIVTKAAALINENKGKDFIVLIEGHTDKEMDRSFDKVGDKRARAVERSILAHLQPNRFSKDLILTATFGKRLPIYGGNELRRFLENRRVEIHILSKEHEELPKN